jgi:hypothetical protein
MNFGNPSKSVASVVSVFVFNQPFYKKKKKIVWT